MLEIRFEKLDAQACVRIFPGGVSGYHISCTGEGKLIVLNSF